MYDSGNLPLLAASDASSGTGATTGHGDERDRDGILEALEATVDQFQRLIANRSADELRRAAHDGRWGIGEILSHLQDWEEVHRERVRRILDEDQPELEEHDDTLWSIEHDYGSRDGHMVFEAFAGLRWRLIGHLRDLEETAWQRRAVLAGQGQVTLRWLLHRVVEHDGRHLDQARDVFG